MATATSTKRRAKSAAKAELIGGLVPALKRRLQHIVSEIESAKSEMENVRELVDEKMNEDGEADPDDLQEAVDGQIYNLSAALTREFGIDLEGTEEAELTAHLDQLQFILEGAVKSLDDEFDDAPASNRQVVTKAQAIADQQPVEN
jgi:hypothetical protein